jgi:hypothetical protein
MTHAKKLLRQVAFVRLTFFCIVLYELYFLWFPLSLDNAATLASAVLFLGAAREKILQHKSHRSLCCKPSLNSRTIRASVFLSISVQSLFYFLLYFR